ncbi:hypothetical protein HPB52_007838 [Rhipicephalus sanguineus]|uniref:Uncharacterized protein n=1 Tax=Rhipicephalus sanguineus TaxID=34632 RepID=A0A9D4T5F3_RHISA|nr:hypothetical protein HPB52_007838 [Rhipicephalus sanguineus]
MLTVPLPWKLKSGSPPGNAALHEESPEALWGPPTTSGKRRLYWGSATSALKEFSYTGNAVAATAAYKDEVADALDRGHCRCSDSELMRLLRQHGQLPPLLPAQAPNAAQPDHEGAMPGKHTSPFTDRFRYVGSEELDHFMHGTEEQLFAGLVRNPSTSVNDFLNGVIAIKHPLHLRYSQYHCLNSGGLIDTIAVTAVTATDESSLCQLIRAVVQEEVKKLTTTSNECAITSDTEVV